MNMLRFIERYWWGVLGLVGIITYTLIMLYAQGQSIWFDESYSILLAKHSVLDLWALTGVDAHPPFYYLLLKGWATLFGYSEFALRSLSAVLMSATVVAALALIKRFFSVKVALYAVPFIMFAPFIIRYGYEVRMYALAAFIAIIATHVLLTASSSKGAKWWIIYALLVALGMYTLYMTLVVWLAHVVWLMVQSIRSGKKKVWQWKWLYAFAGAVLLFAAYIPTFVSQMLHSALPGIGHDITLTQLGDTTSVLFLFTPEWQMNGWLSLLLIGMIGLIIAVAVRSYKQFTNVQKKSMLLILLLVVVPLAFYIVTSLPPRTPIFINRYLAHISVFMYLAIGIFLGYALAHRLTQAKRQKRLSLTAYVVTLLVLGIGMVQLHTTGNYIFERAQLPHTQQLRQSIECGNDTVIVADDPYTYIDSAYYFDGCDLRFFNKDPLQYKGGYAMLSDGSAQIYSSDELLFGTIIVLGWDGREPTFVPSTRYTRVSTEVFGKQVVYIYRFNEE